MSTPRFSKLRQIVESQEVSLAVDLAEAEFDRFEDGWEALKWLLARKADTLGASPTTGATGIRLYVQDGDYFAKVPTIWLVYQISGDQVEISAVKFIEARFNDDDGE